MPPTGPPAAAALTTTCPKRMTFGPCGGVRADRSCEMHPAPCIFTALVPGAPEVDAVPLDGAPRVLADFSVPAFDSDAVSRAAGILRSACDAVLVGEHQNRPDFPPTQMAALLAANGIGAWVTLTCRDRNRVVLEQELHGLRQSGIGAVLCVTGDGRGYDVRPDVTQVFDLDSTRLTSLAAETGLVAAVAETPTAPPRALRPHRLIQKQDAGASVAVLNHVEEVAEVAEFMRTARDAGLHIPVIASVVIYTDPVSAAVLQGLPGIDLATASVAATLAATDPVAAGIDAAVAKAEALLAIDGVVGVNLSGLASARGYVHAAEVKAEVGTRLRAELAR
ncbi:methylenetetrahydrofolate reductase C-terminal domain-containing protein [Jatrophihabitans sp.]|uniref:methylenetetrahydrofolate reductase C-terminal domain-containing protein n=1 Tax=Jatrophihabitans sp. TaxID=1932789 RepID=UPI0030C6921B|nr:methylenetetrahydrofolate reductase [Jatrophihabitans sp.]